MRVPAYTRTISNASSTSSTEPRPVTDSAPGLDWVWRFAGASSRRSAVASSPAIGSTGLGPCSPSPSRWRAAWRWTRAPRPGMTDNAVSVLVVDDEPPIRRFLRTSLTAQGCHVIEAERGVEAIDRIQREWPDVIVLDLGLPDIDGVAVIQRVRQASSVPIVVLSSRSDERGKVAALDLGADDYVTKPFGVEELMARIRTALRHRLHQAGEPAAFVSGDLSVDRVRRIVRVRGEEVKLTPKEYDILRLLVAH